jgi:transposase-like protein
VSHTPSPTIEQINALLRDAELLGLSEKARERLCWLAHYCENGESVTATCRHFGIPRMTFYRMFERFDANDPQSLENQGRKLSASQLTAPEVIALIREYRMREPQLGKERIAELLLSQHDVTVSASTVGRVIERERLYFRETPLHWRKRLHGGNETRRVVDVHDGAVCADCARAVSRRRSVKHAVVVGSLLVNIALLASLAFSLLVEPSAHSQVRAELSSMPDTVTDFLQP